jgi:hypothetical protein
MTAWIRRLKGGGFHASGHGSFLLAALACIFAACSGSADDVGERNAGRGAAVAAVHGARIEAADSEPAGVSALSHKYIA